MVCARVGGVEGIRVRVARIRVRVAAIRVRVSVIRVTVARINGPELNRQKLWIIMHSMDA